MTPRGLARVLMSEHPEGVDTDTLFERSDNAGLDPQKVDEALDALRQEASISKRVLSVDGLKVVDLTSLPSVRTRIVGSGYWVSDKERRRYGGSEYLLVREPDNEHDPKAIAVYGLGRKVGHLSAAKAASLASLLDRLSADAYRVTGAGADARSVRLWVDLPRVEALRKFTSAPS